MHTSRRSHIATVLTLVAAGAGVAAVFALALTNHPHRAVLLLAGGFAAFALLRAVWPGQPWFAARYRWVDVGVYLLIAGGLYALSPWTATLPAA